MVGLLTIVFRRRLRRGAVALEYALILAFVAVSILASLFLLGEQLIPVIDATGTAVGDLPNNLDFK